MRSRIVCVSSTSSIQYSTQNLGDAKLFAAPLNEWEVEVQFSIVGIKEKVVELEEEMIFLEYVLVHLLVFSKFQVELLVSPP